MKEVCQRDNLVKALKRVKANKGSPGINGMTVEELARVGHSGLTTVPTEPAASV